MSRYSLATLAVLLMLTAGCHRHHRARPMDTDYQTTQTTHTTEVKPMGVGPRPDVSSSQQTDTVETHRETTTNR